LIFSGKDVKVNNIKIAVDVYGDREIGVEPAINGSLCALETMPDIELVLVGREADILKILESRALARRYGRLKSRVKVVHAGQIVPMESKADKSFVDFPDSSIAVGMELLRNGEASAFVSPGNTGAVSYTAFRNLGRIANLKGLRPGICVALPELNGRSSILLDIGATVDADYRALYWFAVMGRAYYQALFGNFEPRVALINIGAEAEKGNAATIEAYQRLKGSSLKFTGNIEGREVLINKAEVLVCDGFVGNIIAKLGGGFWNVFVKIFRGSIGKWIAGTLMIPLFLYSSVRLAILNPWEGLPVLALILTIGFLVVYKGFRFAKRFFHSSKYGGAQLLGVDGTIIICHGSASKTAILNAIKKAKQSVQLDVIGAISRELSEHHAQF
jgi:glycerol-3-phosphate acyltransferase PlsX